MIDAFLIRAAIAAVLLALIAAPLGCLIVWNRMAYFGETIAQACLVGVALSFAIEVAPTVAMFAVALLAAAVVIALSRQKLLPMDSILALLHHGALAGGIIATLAFAGPTLDLTAFLFGDVFAVTWDDIGTIAVTGAVVVGVTAALWQPLVRATVHPELAAAEGVPVTLVRAGFTLLLAAVIAVAIKVVGILLVIAFLVVPAVAARPLASTPEAMVIGAVGAGLISVVAGLFGSLTFDAPGGPAIVLAMALLALVSVTIGSLRDRRAH